MKKILVLAVLCLFAVDERRARSQVEPAIDPALDISTLQLWPSGAPEVVGHRPGRFANAYCLPPSERKRYGIGSDCGPWRSLPRPGQ